MRPRLPGRELRDRPVLGGRSHVGSAVWAGSLFTLGLLLWAVGAYVPREGADPRWLLLTLAASCALLLFRRTAPGAVVALATLVVAADAAVGPSTAVLINYGDALYAACVWGRRRLADGVLAVLCAAGAALVGLLVFTLVRGGVLGGPLAAVQVFGLYVLVFGSPVISGLSVREHRQRTALERERARQIERMAELDRRSAVSEERGRVARDLHDVIANHLSAIAVQSTAALSMREADPDRTRRALGVIRDSSLHGLTEMRAMIRVLRGADGEQDPRLEAVTPRLDDADRLFADARAAGLEVAVTWSPPQRPLPPRADAAAYRVLQEALTNALRHADPMRVEVRVEYRLDGAFAGGRLVLTVRNGYADGGSADSGDGAEARTAVLDHRGAGAGLTGMRERVHLLGGRFGAGPLAAERAGGRRVWQVRAEIPLAAGEGAEDGEGSEAPAAAVNPEGLRGEAGGADALGGDGRPAEAGAPTDAGAGRSRTDEDGGR
ncbi:sensor histidine kinase [Streptomonospora litoralis]|uniref:histidine kinase n=1 Tax=Streptomonospora litoralis TaxID=2498135 RepID=A0A4P6Q260_9ACTN|nr:histidine kinase [Streptomonospora litoralis]QBI54593.1 Sensor histidine kinase LiaS [Streptomonospora litoralis]